MNYHGALLRDLRNRKKSSQLNITMTSKEITSVKDLKKPRSSEQLINLKLMDNKNDRIKNIDEKLEIHQTEIEKNAAIISQLTNTMINLKDQFVLEKGKFEAEEKKNKQLRDEVERTNKLLRARNFKVQEVTKKLDAVQKELENLKPYQQKVEELNKINSQIRKQSSKVQENLAEKKQTIAELHKDVEKYKQKIQELGNTKSESQKLKNQLKLKVHEAENLNAQLKHLEHENKQMKLKSEDAVSQVSIEIKQLTDSLKEKDCELIETRLSERKLKQKLQKLEVEITGMKSDASKNLSCSEGLKKQVSELRAKLDLTNRALMKKTDDDRSHTNEVYSLKTKIGELQKQLEAETAEKAKLKPFEEKYTNICKKSKQMEDLYRVMIPQIQCPYGHQLSNPITVIPCGHNYCLGCKKGYTKECMLCSGKLKIQAVYRNELMDDIINIVTGIKQIVEMVK